MTVPVVLFVCVRDATMSQMAAAMMRSIAGSTIEVHSGGTQPAKVVNATAARVVEESGASMRGRSPRAVDVDVLRRADKVVVLGSAASLEPMQGMRATVQTWLTGGVTGARYSEIERLRLIRGDVERLVRDLHGELTGSAGGGALGPQHGTHDAAGLLLPAPLAGAVAWVRRGHPPGYGPHTYLPLAALLPERRARDTHERNP